MVVDEGSRIVLMPFDPANVPAVVRALTEARLNAYALNPKAVAVSVPPVSGEQRAEMVRHIRKLRGEMTGIRSQPRSDRDPGRFRLPSAPDLPLLNT